MDLLGKQPAGEKLSLAARFLAIAFPLLLLVSACAPAAQTPSAPAFTSFLVEADWLAQRPPGQGLVLIDVRSSADYRQGHIPGAANLSLAQITDAKNPVRGMVAPKEQVEAVVRGLGLSQDNLVVIYDEGDTPTAARLFWVLHYYGLDKVSVLNGGYARWQKQGRTVDTQALPLSKGNFVAAANPARIADKEYVKQSLGRAGIAILDVRSPGEYRQGHIPGAINLEWVNNLARDSTPDVRYRGMKPARELSRLYEDLGMTPDKEVIVYCQTGVRAAQTYFTLRYLGYGQVRLYDGSWEEWGNIPGRPVKTGEAAE